ncbi:MAG: hypothetical protein JJU45_04675 [Acidimicrobiia bacterium]|nr:hypothetical protein [Acidimicrobiia bacterium]
MARLKVAVLTTLVVVLVSACLASPGHIVDTFAGSPDIEAGDSGDGGQAVDALLGAPVGVAVDEAGNVYISDIDADRVRRVATDGTIGTFAGTGSGGFSGDGGPAVDAQLSRPVGLAVDSSGALYIADVTNHRIRKVDSSGTITTVAGTGSLGPATSGGPATDSTLSFPSDVAVGPDDSFYIADFLNNQVHRVGADGVLVTVAGTGDTGSSGDGGPAVDAELGMPQGVAVDAAGRVYIADTGNNRVRVVDTDGTISTVAGTGTAGFSGDGGLATEAELSGPIGVAFTSSGLLVVGDSGNDRVRMVVGGVITTIAGCGSDCLDMNDQLGTDTFLNFPAGVAVADGDELYIADRNHHRVARLFAGGGSISGRITADGEPLSGLTVHLYLGGDTAADPHTAVVTDSSGWYRFRVPVDGHVIGVEGGSNPDGPWWEGTGDVATSAVIPVATGERVREDFDLVDLGL